MWRLEVWIWSLQDNSKFAMYVHNCTMLGDNKEAYDYVKERYG